jgi:hypothetical protein
MRQPPPPSISVHAPDYHAASGERDIERCRGLAFPSLRARDSPGVPVAVTPQLSSSPNQLNPWFRYSERRRCLHPWQMV